MALCISRKDILKYILRGGKGKVPRKKSETKKVVILDAENILMLDREERVWETG